MALRFLDSFDHYATAELNQKWNVLSGAATVSSGNGRRSTNCLRLPGATNNVYVAKTLTLQTTWIIGFAFKITTIGSAVSDICAFTDAGTNQVELRLVNDGTLRVTRNGTTLGTSASAISAGTWYFIEFKVFINDTTGTYEVKVDGSSWLSGTGADTKNTTTAGANQVRLGIVNGTAGSSFYDYDDVYICDGSGGSNNDFLGDVRVDCYLPNGNGNSSQLTGSDGNSTDNYALVDESSVNGDTDYVQSSTSGQKDTYAFPNMSHSPTNIFGVQVNMMAKKDDSGARSICSVTRSGGSDTDGSAFAIPTSYVDIAQIVETDPNTASAWGTAGFNAAEFGAKVQA